LEQTIWAVHRLDQDTSGLMVFARDRETYRQLSAQFQQRQVHKIYEAVLSGTISETQGVIDLPLWSDPNDRPYQKVDWQQGKPSRTHFQTLATTSNTTRIEFVPVTGRTHQLRVHAAIGLGAPILGDRLYGNFADVDRLHLHARQLQFTHPHLGRLVSWQTETPF
jgi:tRNA pseudouridine32 synthase/23S rRNA pseudouridine746 synthase